MKISVDREELAGAMAGMGQVVDGKHIKEGLRCVRLRLAGTDRLEVFGTDLESGLVRVMGCEVGDVEGGAVAVDAGRLGGIAQAATGARLTIETRVTKGQGQVCVIEGAGSQFRLLTEDAEVFPDGPDGPSAADGWQEVDGDVLSERIGGVVYAAAEGITTRYALQGVLVEGGEAGLRCVASDGRRLAVMDGGNEAERTWSALVSARAMSSLARMVKGFGAVRVGVGERALFANWGRWMWWCMMLEGEFPKWGEVIPAPGEVGFEAAPTALRDAVRRAALMADAETRAVSLKYEEGALHLTAQDPGAGDAAVALEVELAGEMKPRRLDAKFLAQALDHAPGESVRVDVSNKTALVVRGEGYRGLVMGME